MDSLYRIPAETRIGHAHLKVSDIDNALEFYEGILGFEVQARYGNQAVFLSAGGYHHHIALNTWNSRGAEPAKREGVGLFHIAILYPLRRDLALAFNRLRSFNYPISGASDHGVSEAIYLDDPDGNGIELYCDRKPDDWPRTADGALDMFVGKPLNLKSLLEEI